MRMDKLIINERVLILLNNRYFHLLFFGLLIFIGLLPYFSGGFFLLGGDGDYHLSYTRTLRYVYAWNEDGLGLPNYAIGTIWTSLVILSLIESIINDVALVKFILNFSLYYLCFISIYLVCKLLKTPLVVSFIIALFYVLNPFTFSFLGSLNTSLSVVPSVMMLFFWIILKFYSNNFKLFLFFGLLSSFFAFANTNPPLLVILQISFFISVNIASYYFNERYIIREVAKKYFIVLISFILFNFWWLINLYSFISSGIAGKMYTETVATSFLNMVLSSSNVIILRMLSFRTGFTRNPDENYFGHFYNSNLAVIISLIPIMIVSYYAITVRNKTRKNKLIFSLFITYIGILFLAKGNSPPFGFIYDFMFRHLPFFNIFKGPLEKFGVLYLFVFTLLLIFIMNEIVRRWEQKYVLTLFLVYLIFFSVPGFSGNLFPDSRIGKLPGYTTEDDYETRKYKEKNEHKKIRDSITNDNNTEYRILGLPGSRDYYAVTFRIYDNKYYSGVDPILANTNKPFLIYNRDVEPLYLNIITDNYEKLLGIYNIKKILVNEDLIPRYGFPEKENIFEIKTILNKRMHSKSFDHITIYDNKDHFYPLIYSAGFQVGSVSEVWDN